MGKLTGKVAIVTASSYGIGLSIAERLAKDGAKVMISSRKQQNVDKAVQSLKDKGLTVSGVVCHVAKKEHRHQLIEQTVNEFGGIDLLVSNAAVNPIYGPILNSTEDVWDKIFEVNVKSTFFLIKEVVPFMEKRGGGSVVIVSSAVGYITIGSEFTGAYSVSKTALFGMVKALARQLATMNIRVNCLAPGLIKTTFSEVVVRHEGEKIMKRTPLKRIGLSIAERLAKDGAKVMISSRKQQNVDKAIQSLKDKGLTVSGVVCHVAQKEHRQQLIEQTVNEFGGIDLLVSNAAVNPIFGPILNSTEYAWDKIFEVNVKSTFFLVKEVVPYMEKRGGGSVVIVSSASGYITIGSEFTGAYSISKTALFGMVKALARQLATMNIRVNCIAPGLIKTRFSEILAKHEGEEIMKRTPLKRFGEPRECAGIVSFLLSEDASYITGETVNVSGGLSVRL